MEAHKKSIEEHDTAHSPVFSIESVTIGFNSNAPLIEGLSFSVTSGEILGICGKSGCGKTSLLRAIAGLTDPISGQCRLQGSLPEEIGWPPYRRQVVLMMQQPILLEGSVLESLQRPFHYHSAGDNAFPQPQAIEYLERIGLSESTLRAQSETLSVGEQQRISLVRALLLQPKILLLDEPTASVDATTAAKIEGLVAEEIQQRGGAAIVATHQTDRLARWSNRRLELDSLSNTEWARMKSLI